MFFRRGFLRLLTVATFVSVVLCIFWLRSGSELYTPPSSNLVPAEEPTNTHVSSARPEFIGGDSNPISHNEPAVTITSVYSVSTTTTGINKAAYTSHIASAKKLFDEFRPDFEPLTNYKDGIKAGKKAFDDKLPVFSNEELGQFLQVSDKDKESLKQSHADFVAAIPSYPPEGAFSGTGVVYVTGGKYVPVMLISLRMLRRVSPTVPVEVFFGTADEFEPELCEKTLPDLGAKCILLEDVYGPEFMASFNIKGYQFKALSILASSFENVIFMDSDNIPLYNVEQAVLQEPYVSHKYIIWPDYWFRTTSPHFYDIAGITLGPRIRGDLSVTDPSQIPQADLENAIPDKSSESGQLMVSKTAHYDSLLLATYYNLHGYTAYYPLLTQGGGGEGDKETFIAAALALKKPVYQIKEDIHPAGYFTPDFEGSGMMQSLPLDDYNKYVVGTLKGTPRILFIHFNVFKLNVPQVFDKYKDEFASDDKRIRFLGKPGDNTQWYDYRDIELYMWLEAQWCACTMFRDRGIAMKNWKSYDASTLCQQAENHVNWLVSTHNA